MKVPGETILPTSYDTPAELDIPGIYHCGKYDYHFKCFAGMYPNRW
jgi:hypothetical protein